MTTYQRRAFLPLLLAGLVLAVLAPLTTTAQAAPAAGEHRVVSTSTHVAAKKAYTRAEKLKRVNQLMQGSLATFNKVKARAKHNGIDGTLDWADNGCSAPWWTGTQFYSHLFNDACERHDFGYRNYGHGYYTKNLGLSSSPNTKDFVDNTLKGDMRSHCSTTNCFTVAQGYYEAVHRSGTAQTAFYAGECPPGLLCLFDDDHYGDRRVVFKASEDNLKDVDFGDKTSSLKNTSSYAWILYDDDGYHDTSHCFSAGSSFANMDDLGFGDKTSSVKRLSGRSC